MGIETGPSTRTVRTAPVVSTKPSGVLGVKRYSVPATMTSITIPDKVSGFVIQNVGTENIYFNFGEDPSDRWTLKPDAVSPAIPILSSAILQAKAGGAGSTAEVIFWG